MTWYALISLALRVFGFTQWADHWWAKHEAVMAERRKPLNDQEELSDIDRLPRV